MAVDLSVYGKKNSFSDYLRQNAQDEFNRRLAERKLAADEMKLQHLAKGGNDPALIKIANDLANTRAVLDNPNSTAEQRNAARLRLNDLSVAGKWLDKGILPPDGMNWGGFSKETPKSIGWQEAMKRPPAELAGLPPMDVLNGNLPPVFADVQQPEEYDIAQLEQQLQQGAGQPPQYVQGVSTIPGYSQAVAQMAAQKKGAETQAAKDVELNMNPLIAERTAAATERGKNTGEDQNELSDRMARQPQLLQTVKELSSLGQKSTYTLGGQIMDTLRAQTSGYGGLVSPASEGAIARSEYISKVDNEVLPLLRQTFGAQFTKAEGDSLKNTLGDPDKTPQEKDAVLRSFIATKMQTINSLARRVGDPEPYSMEEISSFVQSIGKQQAGQSGGVKFLGFE